MPIRRSPNGVRHVRPQPGRNRPERVVAINRNAWSQSVGTGGRNHPVRAGSARHALARYRQRWTIETMFGNLKTKGFALEATHLTSPHKLCTLLALMAFAVALTVKTGVAMARLHAIPIKKHGRRAWSLFALGLNTLRKIFVAASAVQIIEFLDQLFSPKLPVKAMRSLACR
jgi:hypothetical protein